jgi:hypothetical protein
MFAANDCRKVDRLVEPVVPPRSVINASKLVCSAVSAVLAAVVVVVASLDAVLEVPAIDWIKLCTSAANPGGGPLGGAPPGGGPDGAAEAAEAADVVESDVASLLLPSAASEDDCDLRAVIRLFKKVCSA